MSLARRLELRLDPDPSRVLLRSFLPSLVVKPTGAEPDGQGRLLELVHRVATLDDATVGKLLERVEASFVSRHRDQAVRVADHIGAKIGRAHV